MTPRRRVRSQADVVRLIVALALIGVGVLVATWLRNTIGGAEEDLVDVYERVPDRFAEALTGLAVLGAGVVPVVALVVLVVRRRFRQALTLLFAGVGAIARHAAASPSSWPTRGSSRGSTPTPTASSS